MKLKYDFIINELGDSFIAVPMNDTIESFNGVLKFNKETAFVIELLNNDISYDELCEKVAENFIISVEDTKNSIDEILFKLRESELIEE